MRTLLNILLAAALVLSVAAQSSADKTWSMERHADSLAASYYTDSLKQDTTFGDTVRTLTLHEKLDSILSDRLLNVTQIAFMAYDLTADTVIYARNEHQTMRPASTMKLLTAIAALDRLGGSYRLATSLLCDGKAYVGADGEENSRTLAGNLIVKGGMDPRFGGDDMHAFVESVRSQRIDTIYGGIVADMSFKDPQPYGEGWCWDDDNPVLTALPWNRKDTFIQKFKSALADAGIAVITPDCHVAKDSACSASVDTISSDTPQACQPLPGRYEVPLDRVVLCTRHHTIDQILTRMMKHSDNLYAESLFYHYAASWRKPAKSRYAADAMKHLLRKMGVTHTNYRIADGSGLSLYNYQTADMQIRMLRYAYRNANIYEHLFPSLPIAGTDGTLKRRMRHAPCMGNVRGKTGTLAGVSALSGYLKAGNGNDVAFVIINQGAMRAAMVKKIQDSLCKALCE